MSVVVGVMARAPIPGRCKTRLAKSIGDDAAAQLYAAMLDDTLAALTSVGAARLVVLAAPEDDGARVLRARCPAAWDVHAQRGEDLGARLGNAFADLGEDGASVALVSSDTPLLPTAAIARALRGFGGASRVLAGPSEDGGYYLIGMTSFAPGVLARIPWSTSAVMRETRARCAELGLALEELPLAYDVDEVSDLDRLREDVLREPARAPACAAFFAGTTKGKGARRERVVAVIPALNEAASIGRVVRAVSAHVDRVVVVDNGSTDSTGAEAEGAGADVVREPARGYGAACHAGIARARELGATILLFVDGDGSADASDAPALLAAVRAPGVDLALGVRSQETTDPLALTPVQRFGNAFATLAMRLVFGARYADIPPFKAIRVEALDRLTLTDRGMGFPIELLLEAHRARLSVREVPVRWRCRDGGESKVSGNVRGSVRAGSKILWVLGRYAATQRRFSESVRSREARRSRDR